jgi:hypothetical protein
MSSLNVGSINVSALSGSGNISVDNNVLNVDTSNNRIGVNVGSPVVGADFGGVTDGLKLPAGTTAQRPGTGSQYAGTIRRNTELGQIEIYTGTFWQALASGGGYSTDGLIAYYDVSNSSSYTGGSSLNNLVSGSGYGSFTNSGSPSYSGDYGGGLQFTGSSHCYMPQTTNLTYFTCEVWFQWRSNQGGEDILFNKENVWEMRSDSGVCQWAVYANNRSWFWQDSGGRFAQSVPQHVALAYDGNAVYTWLNGGLIQVYNYPNGGVLNTSGNSYPKFNARSDGTGSRGNPGNNTLYKWRLYNRKLSSGEIRRNYDAERSQFGYG